MIHDLFRYSWILINIIGFTLLTLLFYAVSFIPLQKIGLNFRPLFRLWSVVFSHALGVNIKLHQHNKEKLPKHFIMIANHPSAFEDIGLPALFDVISLAKIEVSNWWILGRISDASGSLYVDRKSKKSRSNALRTIIKKVNEGYNVALYPEGGCKDKRIAQRFLFGAFEASLKTGVPIIPVFIHYEAQDDFYWGPKVPLVKKLWQIFTASNHTANFHVFDAFQPQEYADKQTYNQTVYDQYLIWQKQYLDT